MKCLQSHFIHFQNGKNNNNLKKATLTKIALFSHVLQADEAKPKEAEKPKPKKFNIDEHFNHELHAIMKYLFPSLMPQAEEVVKKTEKIAKSPTKKRKRVENDNSTNDQETNVSFYIFELFVILSYCYYSLFFYFM